MNKFSILLICLFFVPGSASAGITCVDNGELSSASYEISPSLLADFALPEQDEKFDEGEFEDILLSLKSCVGDPPTAIANLAQIGYRKVLSVSSILPENYRSIVGFRPSLLRPV